VIRERTDRVAERSMRGEARHSRALATPVPARKDATRATVWRFQLDGEMFVERRGIAKKLRNARNSATEVS
jgi:hypothetical protein